MQLVHRSALEALAPEGILALNEAASLYAHAPDLRPALIFSGKYQIILSLFVFRNILKAHATERDHIAYASRKLQTELLQMLMRFTC